MNDGGAYAKTPVPVYVQGDVVVFIFFFFAFDFVVTVVAILSIIFFIRGGFREKSAFIAYRYTNRDDQHELVTNDREEKKKEKII